MKKTLLSLGLLCGLQTATAETTLSGISGSWYDPAYNGSGFNVAEFSNGLFAYFYGYKGGKNGEAQWLLTESGIPAPIVKGKTYTINLVSGFLGNGGSFTAKPTKPADNQSGVKYWGTLKLRFNSCNSGVATLNGKDGKLTHNIVPLAGLSGLTCTEKQSSTKPLTALKKFGIFTVQSDKSTVVMDGEIKTRTLNDFQQLFKQYPNIKTINIEVCGGSLDDETNLQLSQFVHSKGINTHVMDDGEIASGGVDFFLAGKQRTLGKNAKVGVHSWADGAGNTATKYLRGHEYHLPYIAYYKSIGFTQKQAEDFYYFTINAAPAEGIHWMTSAELKKYQVMTEKSTTPTSKKKNKLKQQVLAKAIRVSTNDKGFIEADLGNGIVMIYVPTAKFVMGNNHLTKEKAKNTYSPTPAHQVELSGYWIAKTPTTIGQFRRFVKATKYVTDVEKPEYDGPYVYDFAELGFLPKKGYRWDNAFKDVTAKFPEITVNDQHPVSSVSWYDAQAYAQWLSKKTGLNVTLPTEAQWEYAARGDDGRIYPWGNAMPDGTRANYADEVFDRYFPHTGQSIVHRGVNDGFAITSPVGSFPNGASFIGALDMAGNLTEWVEDSEYEYTATTKHNPRHTHNSNIKMQKGGFWAGSAGRDNVSPDEIADGHNIRSDARQGDDPHSADDHLGFRIGIF